MAERGAWYPGGFNPCTTYQVKNRFQGLPFKWVNLRRRYAEVARVLFNPANDAYLAVAGFNQCQVFTLGPKGGAM
jgi:hypothetical protein